jgi:flagellar motor protein MotB
MRRKRDPSSGWAITFADLMGLLVSFFVMLTVLMTQNSEVFKSSATAMRKAFKSGHEIIITMPPAPQK